MEGGRDRWTDRWMDRQNGWIMVQIEEGVEGQEKASWRMDE